MCHLVFSLAKKENAKWSPTGLKTEKTIIITKKIKTIAKISWKTLKVLKIG